MISIDPLNDIDVFVDIDQLPAEECATLYAKAARRRIQTHDIHGVEVYYDEYRRCLIKADVDQYRIINAERFGLLNRVVVEYPRYRNKSKLQSLVDTFDLNCIQAGVDLETGDFYATDAFWYFLQTKQLELANAFTPAHSMIRYLIKKKEMSVYGNDKHTANIVQAALRSRSFEGYFAFGEQMKNKALGVIGELNALGFCVSANSTRLGAYTTYSLKEFGPTDWGMLHAIYHTDWFNLTQEIGAEFKLSNLVPLFSLFLGKLSFTDAIERLLNTDLKHEEKKPLVDVLFNAPHLFKNVGVNCIGSKSFSHMFKTTAEHSGLERFIYLDSLERSVEMFKTFKQLEKQYGRSMYGFIEKELPAVDTTRELIEERYIKEMEELKTQTIEPFGRKSIEFRGVEFVELTSAYELQVQGHSQKHCVGGYWTSVKHDRCRIVRLVGCDELNVREITVEVRPVDPEGEESFRIAQAMYKLNEEVGKADLRFCKEGILALFEGKRYVHKDDKSSTPIPF